jgi:hypothetical protein
VYRYSALWRGESREQGALRNDFSSWLVAHRSMLYKAIFQLLVVKIGRVHHSSESVYNREEPAPERQ